MFLRDLGNCGQSHHQLQPIDIDFNEFYTNAKITSVYDEKDIKKYG